MTLLALRYFIAVARHKSFTKAARECFVTQPALSHAIHELEQEIGCQLFVRTSRSVELTDAGECCLAEARRILNQVSRMPDKVREAARVKEPPMHLGYIIYDHLMTLMTLLSSQQSAGTEPLPLDPHYRSCSAAKQQFRDRELDALLLPEPCVADLEGAESTVLQKVSMALIVSHQNPLFGRESLSMDELRGQRFIGWSRAETPLLEDAYEQIFRRSGFEPNIIGYAEKLGDMALQVIAHDALGFGSTITHRKQLENIRIIPVTDCAYQFGLSFVWHKGDTTQRLWLIRRLIEESRV